MRAVILAAGLGKRLGPLTERSTKFMVGLNGRPIGAYALDALAAVGVERIVLVVGHGAEEVTSFVGQAWLGVPVTYVENPAYAETNNIYSLLLARDHLIADDTLLLESDLIFDSSILAACLDEPAPNLAVVAPYEPWMEGTAAVVEQGRVVRLVMKGETALTGDGQLCKTVNIYKLSREFCRDELVPFLAAYVEQHGPGVYYEEVLKVLVATGTDVLGALGVGHRSWYEIDDAQDLEIAATLFADEDHRLSRLRGMYGGYWRFPHLQDFTYLVNPYFPGPALLDELRAMLPRLVAAYPSGLATQRFLAARMFGCAPESVLVGNGASELIGALLAEIDGPLVVPVPTFDEYPRLVGDARLVPVEPTRPDLRHDVADLVRACRDRGAGALVLVNPDNPTGRFFSLEVVHALADDLRALGCRLILDESFVDFVDGTPAHSLVHPDALARHPNLVVVRSISKSHGVPGLRLGVLAAADTGLVGRVGAHLPIWNVNAFAEWFLQAINRHEQAYREACARTVRDRARLLEGLRRLSLLRPIESAGNYVLCELRGGWTASDLCRRLLHDRWILAKDCTGKRGMGERDYVRFAVRDASDNDGLLDALHALDGACPR